jgi:hypothetical protein
MNLTTFHVALNEFGEQLDAAEKEQVARLITELRQLASKARAGNDAVTANAIREKVNKASRDHSASSRRCTRSALRRTGLCLHPLTISTASRQCCARHSPRRCNPSCRRTPPCRRAYPTF